MYVRAKHRNHDRHQHSLDMAESGSTTQRVGFAGLGAMGFGMATNMIRKGIDVIAFDLNPVALQNLAAEGGTVASSLREASEGCSKFFVMVATPSQVDSLVFESGENSLWKSLAHGAILCLFSTLPPDYVIGLKKRLEEAGRQDIQLLDAPVSGGAIGAQKGTLSVSALFHNIHYNNLRTNKI
jgi:3-hydroxyisobutyrate dehydrogenase